ncbi:MAG: recombination regulator RecX [Gemmatimonadota bacterium]|nr:recombination regulator RecX [Gemmatimonadota bacterium]
MPSTTIPLITRVQPLKPRGLNVLVHVDVGEPFEIMLEALERHRLGVGDALPAARRHHLLNDDADIRVRDAALNLISYRARTRAELRRRLRQKGFRPARIDPCLDRLQEKGFVDDGAVAAAFVRDRLRHRPRGRVALASELRAKGVAGELANRAIEEVFEDEETDDVDLAREVAERWVNRQPVSLLRALVSDGHDAERAKAKAKRRLVGYLNRRGFRGAAMSAGIDRAVECALERNGDPRRR